MIQDIEHFRAELQFHGFADGEVTMDGKIPLGRAEASQSISPQISLPGRITWEVECRWTRIATGRTSGRIRESAWIERLAAGTSLTRQEIS
jgi:hypothetical protein